VLCTITFDSPDSMYKQDNIMDMMSPSLTNFDKKFMLHYNFPSYAVNDISRLMLRADRREIGHGALAEKAVYPIVPEEYPLTIRAHCEVLESNGSSSMASVCATSMALMDAGVPITEHVCGVAMGIITDVDKQTQEIKDYKIFTDILGFEDYYGDMDFKVAGAKNTITAIQADFKIAGLPIKIVRQVIEKSQSILTFVRLFNNI
jgi:polyribonucleotide nucleotidyltransferase